MKTASFFTYQGPGGISIARYAPRGLRGFSVYKALAPTGDMLRMEYNAYKERYDAILAHLKPNLGPVTRAGGP